MYENIMQFFEAIKLMYHVATSPINSILLTCLKGKRILNMSDKNEKNEKEFGIWNTVGI
jgi:hypothetical protein